MTIFCKENISAEHMPHETLNELLAFHAMRFFFYFTFVLISSKYRKLSIFKSLIVAEKPPMFFLESLMYRLACANLIIALGVSFAKVESTAL